MADLRILSESDVNKLLSMEEIIHAVEQAYVLKSQGKATLLPVINHIFEEGKADMDIKSGDLAGSDIYGLKVVSWFADNEAKHLPPLAGTIMLFDRTTGLPAAVMNATNITGFRTAAASAVGSKYLANKDPRKLLLIGTGGQAAYQILGHLQAFDTLDEVLLYPPRGLDFEIKAAKNIKGRVVQLVEAIYQVQQKREELLKKATIPFTVVSDLKEACNVADVIITVTPAHTPVLPIGCVRKGTHINCIGADAPGKQEIDETIMQRARVFVDDTHQCLSIGECEKAYQSGYLKEADCTEIGHVIAGNAAGRLCDEDITVFDSTGISIQDLTTAQMLLKKATKLGIGEVVAL